MSSSKIMLLVVLGLFILVGFITFMMRIDVNNRANQIRNQANAQEQGNMIIKNKVITILKQKAGLTDESVSKFSEFYGKIMDKNAYGTEVQASPLFTYVKSFNPTFPISMYQDLASDITALQSEFAMTQLKLVDLKREYTNILTTEPDCWFLKNKDTLNITIVVTSSTREAFAKGIDDNIDLYPSKH